MILAGLLWFLHVPDDPHASDFSIFFRFRWSSAFSAVCIFLIDASAHSLTACVRSCRMSSTVLGISNLSSPESAPLHPPNCPVPSSPCLSPFTLTLPSALAFPSTVSREVSHHPAPVTRRCPSDPVHIFSIFIFWLAATNMVHLHRHASHSVQLVFVRSRWSCMAPPSPSFDPEGKPNWMRDKLTANGKCDGLQCVDPKEKQHGKREKNDGGGTRTCPNKIKRRTRHERKTSAGLHTSLPMLHLLSSSPCLEVPLTFHQCHPLVFVVFCSLSSGVSLFCHNVVVRFRSCVCAVAGPVLHVYFFCV